MDKKKPVNELNILRSQELDEMIGKPPSWIIRWGITIFLIMLLLIFTLSYFIRYPQTIKFKFTIYPQTASLPLLISANGILLHINIKEGAVVRKGDSLVYWKSSLQKNISIITSPCNGIVSYVSPLVDNKTVKAGELLFYIVPKSTGYSATAFVEQQQRYNLKVGQQVAMDVNGYPGPDNGYLKGIIVYISSVQYSNGTYVKIKLNNGMITDMGKAIPYRDGLSGDGLIIFNKKRLINKFFQKDITGD